MYVNPFLGPRSAKEDVRPNFGQARGDPGVQQNDGAGQVLQMGSGFKPYNYLINLIRSREV